MNRYHICIIFVGGDEKKRRKVRARVFVKKERNNNSFLLVVPSQFDENKIVWILSIAKVKSPTIDSVNEIQIMYKC